MKHFGMALLIAVASGGAAIAAPSPFAGAWKLDVAKSQLTGDTFTYSRTAKGFHYSNGSTVAFDFAIDGKDYPTVFDRSVAWTAAGKDSWDTVAKAHGVVLSKAHRVLSADGATLTTSYTEYWPNGSVMHESDVMRRVSGGHGLAGEWKDVKAGVVSDTMKIATPAPGRYEISFPNFKETIAGSTDGTPTAINGPTVPPGVQTAYKAVAPDRWEYSVTLKGKTYSKGVMAVSGDGKVLRRTSWVPGKEGEKSVEVYSRI